MKLIYNTKMTHRDLTEKLNVFKIQAVQRQKQQSLDQEETDIPKSSGDCNNGRIAQQSRTEDFLSTLYTHFNVTVDDSFNLNWTAEDIEFGLYSFFSLISCQNKMPEIVIFFKHLIAKHHLSTIDQATITSFHTVKDWQRTQIHKI